MGLFEIITPSEFAERMKELSEDPKLMHDNESRHMSMDYLMEETLSSLGYKEGVEIFNKTPKWYA